MSEDVNKTGGPAFPCPQDSINQNIPSLGMTLRDWFAGMALQGLCVDTNLKANNLEVLAYNLADEMIRQRNQ